MCVIWPLYKEPSCRGNLQSSIYPPQSHCSFAGSTQFEVDRLHQHPEIASEDDPWQLVSAQKRSGRDPSLILVDPTEIAERESAMTIRINAWGKKESWLYLVILLILVAMLGILLRMETIPRQTDSASHESFAAQIAYRR